jgi:hypothetical protein
MKFTEEEKSWLTELEIEKLTPILEILKGVSYKQAENILSKALGKLKESQENLIF